MYISCLATDYDGTLAHDGLVEDETDEAHGAELPDLTRVFPRIDPFDRVVAENGALLFDPATKKETPLGPEPSTWAMMLLGFAGLAFAGYRRTREPRAA
jgi:hydroxymethylpyrimidine pyrophosphatase-like HAD family hydrolase